MIPVTFEGCFGWLHPGAGTRGVVLCGAFGHENMNAHRGWRALAERLAASGLHVVRFDYPGTGDSSGSDADPHRLEAWQGGICAAVDFLRSTTATDGVILIGLRLGATLALMASSRIERVDAVACLAPVTSGKSYKRELRLLAKTWREANHLAEDQSPDGDLDVVGDRLTGDTLRELSTIDLRTLRIAVPHVLLMQESEGPLTADLLHHLAEQGCTVSTAAFVGASDYLQDSLSCRLPDAAFTALLEWCARLRPEPSGPRSAPPVRLPAESVLRMPDATEQAFRFGPADELFGILCCPGNGPIDAAPTVIMLNTGFGRHIGDARVLVTLARRLAAMGVASLRMDIAGFGDSGTRHGVDPEPYGLEAVADVVAAVDALERAGHPDPFLIGICSGAHAAFNGAVAERRVRGLVLVNIQKFIWKTGLSLKLGNDRQRRPLGFYLRSLGRVGAWRRLVGGHVDIAAILTVISRRIVSGLGHRLCLLAEARLGVATRAGQIARWFDALDARAVGFSLLYSEADPGLSELTHHFGRDRRALRRLPHVGVELLPKADHALLDRNARCHFIETTCRIIQRHMDRQPPGARRPFTTGPVGTVPASVPELASR